MLVPVILSGGSGTRLWPLSREHHPKQFLPLVGEESLLQDTLRRVAELDVVGPLVVCNEHHRFMVAEKLRQIAVQPTGILLEPIARNTAPAVAVAALAAQHLAGPDTDAIMLVLPADHMIVDVQAFHRAVTAGLLEARAGKLVTFGVVPTKAEVGYGYIRYGAGAGPGYPIIEFVEKPSAERAAHYVASGEYLWNSGMFLFSATRYLQELQKFAPAMHVCCEAAWRASQKDLDFIRLPVDEFSLCPSDSIDYAVMEKTSSAVMVPLDAGWSDVGSWSALHESLQADERGNVTRGDVISEDASGCYLYSTDRLVAAVGLVDHVVIETKDAVLVAPKTRVQDVKNLVATLKRMGRSEPSLHREVFRPWGSYDSVDGGARFKVKRLTVNPGAKLSLQMHHHRAEHWIVVEGSALITCNDRVFTLSENESTYIPVGATHRIENPGTVPLHIIEVQSGSYLGEDDIVRFEDTYGRQGTNT
jgi:mannose-1-phosphate guanylyltransferase/mannose-6-phosphate isomerase